MLATILSLPYLIAYLTGNLNFQIHSIYETLAVVIWINLILGVFNLIPVSPLDGFKVLAGLLPKDWYRDFVQTERYGIFILLLLLLTGVLGQIIFPIVSFLFNLLAPGLAFGF